MTRRFVDLLEACPERLRRVRLSYNYRTLHIVVWVDKMLAIVSCRQPGGQVSLHGRQVNQNRVKILFF
jgi:hypothetical protein